MTTPGPFLPIIAPAPDGADSYAYYDGLFVVVTADTWGNHAGLKITISSHQHLTLFAMFDGEVSFKPAGNTLPLSADLSPSGGSLILKVSIGAALKQYQQRWPVAATSMIHYLGVNSSTVRTVMEGRVSATPDKVKKAAWRTMHSGNDPPPGTDLNKYLVDRFMAGGASISMKAGDSIGAMNSLFTGGEFELRCIGAE